MKVISESEGSTGLTGYRKVKVSSECERKMASTGSRTRMLKMSIIMLIAIMKLKMATSARINVVDLLRLP